ncbi:MULTISPECIES: tyrosine-type recombinase/integrase [Pseudomonas]|uniref:Site-specific integrase n=1 Tax=Pseudomonas aegrilactucae TaxID=2854028 RepID=A0A9Q2XHA6_9PSED|nr:MULTISPECIES: site-specific integrase [Pseudomonas]MBC3410220.1 site-specific integrase [Pseudomonas sp. SWRI51]MBV6287062.1 site-specific integrase [Pseudomonas aegrilactucae]MDD2075054.1 site-specific integrase [Pseudomonas putida]WRW01620.1 site-specific integrase [Pseudomonas putida]HDS1690660.1 site-specific integrase [Pseudomonas putida]
MHLILSTREFKLAGLSLEGFPILLHDSMESCVPANDFLRSYLRRGAIRSPKTWAAAGEALYDYFSFLQAHNLHWRDVDRGESKTLLHAYRDYCFNIHNLATRTVRLRLFFILRFYKYALKTGLVSKLPTDLEIRAVFKDPSYLAHISGSSTTAEASDVMPRLAKTLPKYLTMKQTKLIIKSTKNVHHRALIKFALRTGLRREELATFPLNYIKKALATPGKTANVKILLDPEDGSGIKTKRKKSRSIWVSRSLINEVNLYIKHYRGERIGLGRTDNERLFVNQDGRGYSNGGKALEKIVKNIGRSIGLEVTPHMLRHTYATHTLVQLQRTRSVVDPIAFLRDQLGHSSINTTMIYAHLVDDYVDDAVLEYDRELSELED